MRFFFQQPIWAIASAAILGGAYGLFATLNHSMSGPSLWGAFVPAVCGAALFACIASAVCRWISACQLIRENRKSRAVGVKRAIVFANSADLTGEPYDEARPTTGAPQPGRSIDLWICTNVNEGIPCSDRGQNVWRNRFHYSLNEALKDSVLE